MPENAKKSDAQAFAEPYETHASRAEAAVDAYLAHKQENPPPPRLKVAGTEGSECGLDQTIHTTPPEWFCFIEALGTKDQALVSGLLASFRCD